MIIPDAATRIIANNTTMARGVYLDREAEACRQDLDLDLDGIVMMSLVFCKGGIRRLL